MEDGGLKMGVDWGSGFGIWIWDLGLGFWAFGGRKGSGIDG